MLFMAGLLEGKGTRLSGAVAYSSRAVLLYRTTAFEKALIDSPTINEANASPGSPSVHDVTKHRLHPQQTLRNFEFLVFGHA